MRVAFGAWASPVAAATTGAGAATAALGASVVAACGTFAARGLLDFSASAACAAAAAAAASRGA